MDDRAPRAEQARTDGLAAAVTRILPALDEFSRFRGPDPVHAREQWRARLQTPLPRVGLGAEAVLQALDEVVIRNGLRVGAPGFCGWITTMPTVVPTVANLAATVAAPQKWWLGPGNILESVGFRWLAELIGLPDSFAGAFVSGGAAANLLCLTAARQHAGERLGIDPAADGVYQLPEPRVYCTKGAHNVVVRALGLLGLGRRQLIRIAERGRKGPDTAALEDMLADDRAYGRTPIAVVATAGDADTGAIDPIAEMQRIARAADVWLHVDGAYGGFGVLDARVRARYGDLSAIDSLAIDPHKWLAVPTGCGAGYVRDRKLLERALALEPADYARVSRVPGHGPRSSFDFFGMGHPDHSLEHSAPARGVAVWAALAEIGVEGMRARVARHLDCARRVAERVRENVDLELLAEPVLSICCFRYHPPRIRDQGTLERLNQAILAEVRARGRCVPSSTRVRNKFALRPCFIGARATLNEADLLVDEVLAAARAIHVGASS